MRGQITDYFKRIQPDKGGEDTMVMGSREHIRAALSERGERGGGLR